MVTLNYHGCVCCYKTNISLRKSNEKNSHIYLPAFYPVNKVLEPLCMMTAAMCVKRCSSLNTSCCSQIESVMIEKISLNHLISPKYLISLNYSTTIHLVRRYDCD